MAARFRVGASTLWSDTSGWSTTSGGAGGSAVPTSSDDVTFDANSTVSVTLDTPTAKNALSLTCTNYAHTLTFNTTLTVVNNVTLGASMAFAGSSALIVSSTSTITTHGVTVTVPLTLSGAVTYTLGDVLNVSGLLSLGPAGGSNAVINSNSINASGSVTISPTSGTLTGTTILNLTGTGTLTAANSTVGGLRFNLVFNTAGTITLSGTLGFGSGTMTYTAGTVTAGSSTLLITASCTLNVAAVNWFNVTHTQAVTITLSANLNVTGTLTVGGGGGTTVINGAFTVNTANLVVACTTGNVSGTSSITLNGTGNWSDTTGTGGLRSNLIINTAGTVTISGTVRYSTGTITYTAGTVAPGGTLAPNASCSLDLNGLILSNLLITTAGVTITFLSGMQIRTSVVLTGTAASTVKFVSSVGGTQRAFTVISGASEDVGYTDATDIDSSAGVPVYHFKGTITNTLNWSAFSPVTPGAGFLSGVSSVFMA